MSKVGALSNLDGPVVDSGGPLIQRCASGPQPGASAELEHGSQMAAMSSLTEVCTWDVRGQCLRFWKACPQNPVPTPLTTHCGLLGRCGLPLAVPGSFVAPLVPHVGDHGSSVAGSKLMRSLSSVRAT